ncbi:hypothetical protein L3476_05010 [Paenibacillus thiaminolyticus]|uniref:hypothetical protein n=1 Tax=Paenibacillus thiaminolyticus TaxID=49283 RepID=UPI00234FDB81|nr:hypothetical protein [Paenibacillus thiaminolyticus]WCR28126.1 hypothetical protein L3476_05010 [Paenibacillus thiaminolyticus]
MSPEGDDALNAKFRLGNPPSEKQGFSNSLKSAGFLAAFGDLRGELLQRCINFDKLRAEYELYEKNDVILQDWR